MPPDHHKRYNVVWLSIVRIHKHVWVMILVERRTAKKPRVIWLEIGDDEWNVASKLLQKSRILETTPGNSTSVLYRTVIISVVGGELYKNTTIMYHI